MSITVLVVGGTGESYVGDDRTEVTGLLSAVTDCLDRRFIAQWVPYAASYGPVPYRDGLSYAESVDDGVANLAAAFGTCAGPVALLGYSQGAVVVRRFATHLTGEQCEQVIGVGLVADPHQPPGGVAGCEGWGVAGPGDQLPSALPVCWIGTPDDMICNASPDSLLRDIADLTGAMSFHHPGRWLSQVRERLLRNDLQNADATSVSPEQWRRDPGRIVRACREVCGYLPRQLGQDQMKLTNTQGGQHTSYATTPYGHTPITDADVTGCQTLAMWLQVQATFTGPGRTTGPRSATADRPSGAAA